MTPPWTPYHIRLRVNGTLVRWTRFGPNMEECLKNAKTAATKEYGDKWQGGIEICGPQGDSGIYAF